MADIQHTQIARERLFIDQSISWSSEALAPLAWTASWCIQGEIEGERNKIKVSYLFLSEQNGSDIWPPHFSVQIGENENA